MIPYGRQNLSEDDVEAVVDVLKSDFLTQGPAVPRFEAELSRRFGGAHVVAVNSATSALHVACLALGLRKGDWLWTSPVSFVASSNCGLYCGANVDFVDIDPKTYTLCPIALEVKLREASKIGRLPKVVVPVHLCGQSCDMKAIARLAKEYGFKVIEDASHSIGSSYCNEPVGNCDYSDIAVFSFHPVKIITTAEGGAASTNCPELDKKMRLFRSHGITRDHQLMQNEVDGPWYYEQICLGYNYRMTDLQAALGASQLKRLAEFVAMRTRLAQVYDEQLSGLPIVLPYQGPCSNSSWHLYVVRLDLQRINKSKKQVFEALRQAGIGVNVHYIPIYKQPYYRALGFSTDYCPNAESYYNEAISLPLYPDLAKRDQMYICEQLGDVLR